MTFSSSYSSYLFKGFGSLIAGICLLKASTFPILPVWLTAALFAYAVLLWYFPSLWLFVLPALLPIFDLAPWSGRFFFNEFDLLILVTIAVRLLCWERWGEQLDTENVLSWLLWSFFAVTTVSALRGMFPLPPLDLNAFSNYYSPYNSLRIYRGFCWAFLLLPFLLRDLKKDRILEYFFIPGILAGLGGTIMWSLWERQVFTGLFNLTNDFRITAGFSTMHTGGATIDAYLAMTLPFVVCCFIVYKSWFSQLVGAVLGSLGLYALVVTFSRIGYLAIVAVISVLVTSFVLRSGRRKFLLRTCFVLMGTAAFIFIAIQSSPFIQNRFEKTARDLDSRLQHWSVATDLMNADFKTKLFGMGLGSYPRTIALSTAVDVRPATYRYIEERNNVFVRLFAGDSLYLGQRVSLVPGVKYTIRCQVRSDFENARLTIPVCQKSILYSYKCAWPVERFGNTAGEWVRFEKTIQSTELGKGSPFYQRRPVILSLYNGQPATFIDVDDVQLIDARGISLLRNGSFEQGNDFWFFSVDNHMPWHIKNLWIHLLFEQGWIGLITFSGLLIIALVKLFIKIKQGVVFPIILLCSLSGFLTVGLIGSLFDSPRITLLFLLLLFTSLHYAGIHTDEK